MSKINTYPDNFRLERCPRCSIHKPNLCLMWQSATAPDPAPYRPPSIRTWATYLCMNCGGAILLESQGHETGRGIETVSGYPIQILPEAQTVPSELPAAAARYLLQALNSMSSPDAAVLMAASSIDAMMKNLGLKEGALYSRIIAAKGKGLITEGMAEWAHEVRLAANDQRHAEEDAGPNSPEDAKRLVEFALALAEFLFVLPARVERGRNIGKS